MFRFKLHNSDVVGLSDSLTARPKFSDVWTRSQANAQYRPIGYVPAYSEITGKPSVFPSTITSVAYLTDSLHGKVNNWQLANLISLTGQKNRHH